MILSVSEDHGLRKKSFKGKTNNDLFKTTRLSRLDRKEDYAANEWHKTNKWQN